MRQSRWTNMITHVTHVTPFFPLQDMVVVFPLHNALLWGLRL